MDLPGIGASVGVAVPARVEGAGAKSVAGSGASSPSMTVAFSRRGQFTSKVLELAKTDPAEATKLVADLAAQMRDRASGASGHEASRLGKLADLLQHVADTGDFSALMAGAGAASGAVRAYAVTRSSR